MPTTSASSSPLPARSGSSSSSLLPRLRTLLQQLLRTALHRTDATLLHLSRVLSTPAGIDSLLCTCAYTLTLLHARLARRLALETTKTIQTTSTSTAPLTAAAAVAIAAAKLPSEPGDTGLLTTAAVAAVPAADDAASLAHLARLARRLDATRALAALIGDVRVFARLWGLVEIYAWGRRVWACPPRDAVEAGLVWAQIAANVLFQGLENGAFLAGKRVLLGEGWVGEEGRRRENQWWLWSSRFWAVHVALEGVRLGWVRWRRRAEREREREREREGGREGEKEEKLRRERWRQEDREWWTQLVSNAAYAPLTLHWSLEEGCVSEAWVGFFGAVAGATAFWERWRETA